MLSTLGLLTHCGTTEVLVEDLDGAGPRFAGGDAGREVDGDRGGDAAADARGEALDEPAAPLLVNDAAFVSQVVPGTVPTGQGFDVEITMRNTGTTTWTPQEPQPYRLGPWDPQDDPTWGAERIPMAADAVVVPGETWTFVANLTAPYSAGTHPFRWRMVQEGVEWFGAPSDALDILCEAGCTPDCDDKACGGDGCGGSCGECPAGYSCEPEIGTCTCAPLSCAEAGVPCGTAADGCGGQLDCGPCCSGQCILVLEDALQGATVGEKSGGAFVADGWQSGGWGHRIVYDIGTIDCGYAEVAVTNLDPPTQYVHKSGGAVNCNDVECYVHMLALYRGAHGKKETAAAGCESQIAIQATGPEDTDRPKKLKLKTATVGWGGGGNSYTPKYDWDLDATYILGIEWTTAGATLSVNGQPKASVSFSWPGDPEFGDLPEACEDLWEPHLAFTHFFLGRDQNSAGGYLDGPVYSSVAIFDCGP